MPGGAQLKAFFKKGGRQLVIAAWVPALDNKVIIELESNCDTSFSLELWAPDGSESTTEHGMENDCVRLHRSFANLQNLKWPTYVAMAMNKQNGNITLTPGQKEVVVISLYTNHDTDEWHKKVVQSVTNITDADIENLKRQHNDWWNSFWALSWVHFDDVFLEQYYYQSQYLFACASREGKFAPGIWGPFITSDETKWSGDYHLNYNYEGPYWASFSSNHIGLTANYEEPILAFMERGRELATNVFHCGGVVYPVGIGPKGLCTTVWPRDPNQMKELYGIEDNTMEGGVAFMQQKTNASFVTANLMMRFYSTYDKDYAKRIYPFVKACADFWKDYLIYDNGRFVVLDDTFNEHYPWEYYKGDMNSILSLGLIRMVFQSVTALSRFLKKDRRERAIWNNILNKLSDYPERVNSNGRRSFKINDNLEEKTSVINRIHLHGLLLPSGNVGPILTPEYNDIILSDMKGWYSTDDRDWGATLGNGIETVYPSAARVGYPAKELLSHLKTRVKMGDYPNCYIHAAGGGIETLSAVPNTINEMMMQSYEGILRVFPNWDRSMNGSFYNLRAYGAFLVSSSIENGRIRNVTIKSEKGRFCTFENPWPSEKMIILRNGRKWKVIEGKVVSFKTRSGDVLEIKGY